MTSLLFNITAHLLNILSLGRAALPKLHQKVTLTEKYFIYIKLEYRDCFFFEGKKILTTYLLIVHFKQPCVQDHIPIDLFTWTLFICIIPLFILNGNLEVRYISFTIYLKLICTWLWNIVYILLFLIGLHIYSLLPFLPPLSPSALPLWLPCSQLT